MKCNQEFDNDDIRIINIHQQYIDVNRMLRQHALFVTWTVTAACTGVDTFSTFSAIYIHAYWPVKSPRGYVPVIYTKNKNYQRDNATRSQHASSKRAHTKSLDKCKGKVVERGNKDAVIISSNFIFHDIYNYIEGMSFNLADNFCIFMNRFYRYLIIIVISYIYQNKQYYNL